MAITPQIQSALQGFNEIILGGIPFLLKQNETAFLSFMCSVAAMVSQHRTNFAEAPNELRA